MWLSHGGRLVAHGGLGRCGSVPLGQVNLCIDLKSLPFSMNIDARFFLVVVFTHLELSQQPHGRMRLIAGKYGV